jgi:hypothetical protein
MAYLHFVITQFNLRNLPNSNNSDYENWIKWTQNRIVIFKEYCLPSLVNQTSKNFIWLLYFDVDSQKEFKPFMDEISAVPFIQICYCSRNEDFYENYIREVKKRADKVADWILTTRIDNDDCLHKDAIKIIQQNFIEKNRFLISLASGYVLNAQDKTLSHYFYPMSPFLTLIEKNDKAMGGVFEKGHTKWDELRLFIFREIWLEYYNKKTRKSRFILKNPLWIQIVHGENISNSFYRGLPVLRNIYLHDFSIPYASKKLSLKVLGRYSHYVTWKRYFKCLIIKFIIGK